MMRRGFGFCWFLLLLTLLPLEAWAQQPPRVVGYNPAQTTVGYQPSSNLNVVVQLANFTVPPAPRRAYWGGNEAAGGTVIPIVAAETNATQFIVGIPPALRQQSASQPIVLCQRINLAGGAIDGACTNASQSALFQVNPPPSITSASPLPAGTVNVAYSFTFAATGGTGARTFSLNTGSLPSGLRITSGGELTGTTAQQGTFNFTVRVTDSLGIFTSRAFSLTITGPLTITTPPQLPTATARTPYSVTLTATGGVAPYTWSVPGNDLPPGLSLNASTGAITGAPEAPGEFQFRVTVRAEVGGAVSTTFRLNIASPLVITTAPQFPGAIVGTAYSRPLAASGGSPPYSWGLAPGSSLPAGLSLNASTGLVSGTPTQSGNFSFTIRVTDSLQVIGSRTFTLTVAAALTITTPPQLPGATANAAYSVTLAATGGTTPRTWALVAGSSLPPGLSLTAGTGAISGTPTQSGDFSFTIRVTDAQSFNTTRTFSLNIAPPLAITTPAQLPGGTAGVAYSATLAATGGATPYQWQLAPGSSLPAGLSLNGSTGAVGGTPGASGSFSFTIRVTDARDAVAQRAFSLTIASELSITTPAELPGGTVGAGYSAQLAATGGTTPYGWQVLPGTSLPAGLSLNSGTGAISGTPTQSGSFEFGIRVTDNQQVTATRTFSLTVASGLSITTPSQLPGATAGASYSTQLAAAGGTPSYTWALQQGSSLPAGLSLNSGTGAISGTPTQSGSFSFGIRVTDAQQVTADRTFSLTVASALSISTPAQLPATIIGASYSVQLQATGGTTPYAWQLVSGSSLPQGLALASGTGAISGTPAQNGSFSFTIAVTDAQEATASQAFTLSIGDALAITTPPQLDAGQVGAAYSTQLAAVGGTAPYQWQLTGGSLPPGISLVAGTGALSGTPTQSGDFSFTIQVTDAQEGTTSRQFSLSISSGLAIATPALLQSGPVNSPYVIQFAATGGASPYTWSVSPGSTLPPGLTLNSGTGEMQGTPTQAGEFQFTIRVEDAEGANAARTFSVTFFDGLQFLTTSPLAPGTVGEPVNIPMEAAGGTGALSFTLAAGSSLPEGLSLSAQGLLSGTPAAAFDGSFTVRVADASTPPQTAGRSFAWRVNPPILFVTATLPQATLNENYSQNVQAEGGFPAYVFVLLTGELPAGITLSEDGGLNGTPASAGSFAFTIQVRDQDNRLAEQAFTLVVAEEETEAIGASVAPTIPQPAHNTQQPVTVALTEALDDEVEGDLTVHFVPSTDPPVDDPAVQFVSGGRSVPFRVPAGETAALFGEALESPALQVGTVAGEIVLELALRRDGVDVTPSPAPSATIVMPATAPTLSDVAVTRTATGLNVVVRGFSTGRAMQSATLEFTARPGANISGALSFTVQLASAFTAWYSQEASFEHGSRFQLTIPVNITGDTSEITGLTIRLRNAEGESGPATATF